jgi:hypothetical protein
MSEHTVNEAQQVAQAFLEALAGPRASDVGLLDFARQEPFGWVFYYQSRAYLETPDDSHALVGNGPIVVDRHMQAHQLGTALSVDEYIAAYRSGDLPAPEWWMLDQATGAEA